MKGLIKKDILVIIRNLSPFHLLGFLPPLFVVFVNRESSFPIICMVVSMYLAYQVGTSMAFDEAVNWRRSVTAMPVPPHIEAGSKYVLSLCFALLSSVVVLIIGIIMAANAWVSYGSVVLFSILAFVLVMFYNDIKIPATYRLGAANSRYIFMLFIYIPVIAAICLQTLQVNVDFASITDIGPLSLVALVLPGLFIISLLSFWMSVRVLKRRK
jgi:hypothetical protein